MSDKRPALFLCMYLCLVLLPSQVLSAGPGYGSSVVSIDDALLLESGKKLLPGRYLIEIEGRETFWGRKKDTCALTIINLGPLSVSDYYVDREKYDVDESRVSNAIALCRDFEMLPPSRNHGRDFVVVKEDSSFVYLIIESATHHSDGLKSHFTILPLKKADL